MRSKSGRSRKASYRRPSQPDDVPDDIPSRSIPTSQRLMIVPSFWAEARVQYRRKGKQITIRRFGWSDTSEEDAQHNAQARVDQALARAISGFGASVVYLLAVAGKNSGALWIAGAIGALLTLSHASPIANFLRRILVWATGGPETIARARVLRFISKRSDRDELLADASIGVLRNRIAVLWAAVLQQCGISTTVAFSCNNPLCASADGESPYGTLLTEGLR